MRHNSPQLVLNWYPYLKLQFMCHRGETEVMGFGVSRDDRGPDLLYVEDFYLVRHRATSVYWEMDGQDCAAYVEDMLLQNGYPPAQCSRIQIHTHPGNCPLPSQTDEDNFAKYFDQMDWGLMAILAHGGETYARIRQNAGPSVQVVLPVVVDWTDYLSIPYDKDELAAMFPEWEGEYNRCVIPMVERHSWRGYRYGGDWDDVDAPYTQRGRWPATLEPDTGLVEEELPELAHGVYWDTDPEDSSEVALRMHREEAEAAAELEGMSLDDFCLQYEILVD